MNIYTSRPFQWYKEHLNARCFDPYNQALSFRESRMTPSSHFWECEFHPHTRLKVGLRQFLFVPHFYLHLTMTIKSNGDDRIHFVQHPTVAFEHRGN